MKKKIWIGVLTVLLGIILSISGVSASETVQTKVLRADSFYEYATMASELIEVSGKNDIMTAEEAGDFYLKRLILRVKQGSFMYEQFHPETVIVGMDGIYILQFTSEAETQRAYNEICKMDQIDYVEPDQIWCVQDYNRRKVDFRTEAYHYEHLSWGIASLGVDEYAYQASQKGETVLVAVVDSGIDMDHDWLKARIAPGGYDFDENDNLPEDGDGHGTHVAGTVVDCIQGTNVMILPIRVMDNRGEGSLINVANGITYAVQKGSKVINLSLGGNHSETLDRAIETAVAAGAVVCVAAGNENRNTSKCCPAHVENEGVICVAACDSSENRASFSNYGTAVDVIAPGVNIYSSYLGGTYEYLDGTSMAAPHISGASALIYLMNPGSTPGDIERILKNYCLDLGSVGRDNYYGEGIPVLSSVLTDIAECSATLSQKEFVYDGSEQRPEVTVKDGERTLKENKDYTLTFFDNINAGTARVQVIGMGRYENSKTLSFQINKADNVIQASDVMLWTADSVQNKKLNVSLKYEAKLEYVSEDSSISVSEDGYICIPANYTGKTGVSIRALETDNCNEAEKRINIIVRNQENESGGGQNQQPDIEQIPGQEAIDSEYDYVIENRAAVIQGYKGSERVITIPAQIDGYPVTAIHSSAFTADNQITQVTIGGNVKTLGMRAFIYCGNLEKVIIESGVTSIGDFAFYGCPKLREVSLGETVTTIGNFAFDQCTGLRTVTAFGRNTTFGSRVFGENKYGFQLRGYKESAYEKYAAVSGMQFQFLDSPKENSITASDITKTASSKKQTFSLKAKSLDGTKLKYVSDNKKIKVRSNGKVVVPAGFIGKIVITVTSQGSLNYQAVQKSVTVTVRPSSSKITSAVNQSGRKLELKWKEISLADGYEIQYSTKKQFSSSVKTKKIRKKTVTSTSLTKLKKGKTYYIRIRSYKKSDGKVFYSKWSNIKARKIRN